MESIPCAFYSTFFIPRNRCQRFCTKSRCQRARKSIWQRQKMATNPEYREGQRLAKTKWFQNNPGYWKQYRSKNPKKASRNRSLQRIRNIKKKIDSDIPTPSKLMGIAKMDAGTWGRCLCYTG